MNGECGRPWLLCAVVMVEDCGAALTAVWSSGPVPRTLHFITTCSEAPLLNGCLWVRVQEALRIPCATHKTMLSYHLAYTHCAAGRIGDAASAAAAAAAAVPGDPDAAALAVLLFQLRYEYDRTLRQVEDASGLGAGAAAVALGVRLGRTGDVREGGEGEAGEEERKGRPAGAGAGAGGAAPVRGVAAGVAVVKSEGPEGTKGAAVAAATGAGGSEGPGQQRTRPKGSHGASAGRASAQEVSGEEGAAGGHGEAAAAAATAAGAVPSGAGPVRVQHQVAVGAAGQAEVHKQPHQQAEVPGAGEDRRGRVGSGACMAGGGDEQVHAAVRWQLEALRADPLCVGALAGGY